MQKRLPELLTDHELVGLYEAVWHARNPTHMIMIKLLTYTGLRNAEFARVRLQDADLDHCQLRVVQRKSSKDRSVLFKKSLAIYRDLALADVSGEYEQAMRSFPVRSCLLGLIAASLVLPQLGPTA